MIWRISEFSCFIFLIILFAASNAGATIIHVPGEVATIKAGVSAAATGDTVMVSAGTYVGFGNRDIDFGGKAIVIRSMKGPVLTVINCQGEYLSPHRGFHAHQGEDSRSVIEGFTIINGYAPFNAPGGKSIGGGILCQGGSSPTIKDCVLYGNVAAHSGGGMGCVDGSSPNVIECTIIGNSGIGDTALGLVTYGGGIRCDSSAPTFQDCIIATNRANIGGGLSCNKAQVIMSNCEFIENTADVVTTFEPVAPGAGGGIHLYYSSATLNFCVIDRNSAVTGFNMSYETASGGGIASFYSSLNLTNCTLYGNDAEKMDDLTLGKGAGLYLFDSPTQVDKCIIAYNTGGNGVRCPYDDCSDTILPPTFTCTDIFGNEFGDWTDTLAAQQEINGNFSQPPYFCNPETGQLTLWADSPCTPDSSECGVLIGALDIGCLTDAGDDIVSRPESFSLSQNRPNPFNQSTVIEYTLSASADVEITIYNTLGQIVCRMARGFVPAGAHSVVWNGKDENGADVASGLYFYAVRAGDLLETKRMILLK